MKAAALARFALRFGEVTEEQPFGPDVDVYKVAGKIFLILSPDREAPSAALKCEPGLALELREEYPAVTPGYHLNKDHWNSVSLDGTVPDGLLRSMVAHSYDRVVAGMTLADRKRLALSSRPTTTPLELP